MTQEREREQLKTFVTQTIVSESGQVSIVPRSEVQLLKIQSGLTNIKLRLPQAKLTQIVESCRVSQVLQPITQMTDFI